MVLAVVALVVKMARAWLTLSMVLGLMAACLAVVVEFAVLVEPLE
jgi:hypothetical protein